MSTFDTNLVGTFADLTNASLYQEARSKGQVVGWWRSFRAYATVAASSSGR